MFGILKKIFGTKQDKDVQKYQPRVAIINQFYEQYSDLSNDQLRHKTLEFKSRIADYLSKTDQEILDLKNEAAEEPNIHEKEKIYNVIDTKDKERNTILEEILNEILPEAFAVVKETLEDLRKMKK